MKSVITLVYAEPQQNTLGLGMLCTAELVPVLLTLQYLVVSHYIRCC